MIPLHRPSGVGSYSQQLTYCITQYVEKDKKTAVAIVLGMIKAWPWASSSKQVTFLNELEEILELVSPDDLESVFHPLFRVISKCIGSQHFQVAERCLFLWNSDTLLTTGILCRARSPQFLPLVWADLESAATSHWNPTVSSLAKNVIQHYEETEAELARKCSEDAAKAQAARKAEREERSKKWDELEALVATAQKEAGLTSLDDDTAAGAARAMAKAVATKKDKSSAAGDAAASATAKGKA